MEYIPHEQHTRAGLDRLVFFSDAVIAIAITLLAIPLVDSARDLGAGSTANYFSKNGFALIAAAVSFAAIASIWRDHHRLFERATGYTRLLVRVNFVWLAGTVFLPVATVLLVASEARSDRAGIGIYLGTITITMGLCRAEEYILHRANLLSDGGPSTPLQHVTRWLPVLLRALAFVLAVTIPGLGLWALLVVPPELPLEYALNRLSQKKAPRSA